jgi:hypothetical protein
MKQLVLTVMLGQAMVELIEEVKKMCEVMLILDARITKLEEAQERVNGLDSS